MKMNNSNFNGTGMNADAPLGGTIPISLENLNKEDRHERRYGKTGTSLRLTAKGNLALIKTDEHGYGKTNSIFGFINVHQCPSLLNKASLLSVAVTA